MGGLEGKVDNFSRSIIDLVQVISPPPPSATPRFRSGRYAAPPRPQSRLPPCQGTHSSSVLAAALLAMEMQVAATVPGGQMMEVNVNGQQMAVQGRRRRVDRRIEGGSKARGLTQFLAPAHSQPHARTV